MTSTKGTNVHGHSCLERGAYCPACTLLPDLVGRRYILPRLTDATLETVVDDVETEANLDDTWADIHCVSGVGG